MEKKIEQEYKKREQRVKDAVQLKEPDRVPIIPVMEHFPWYYAGYSVQDVMYDFSKAEDAMDKFYTHFKPDMGFGTIFAYPGKFMEMTDIKWFRWPGHGVEDPNASYQFLEGEYMKEDEYDELIFDPTGFMMNKWMPRCFGASKGLQHLNFRDSMWFGFFGSYGAFLNPEVRETMQKMAEASDELANWFNCVGNYGVRQKEKFGIPSAFGAFGFAPFDMLGDTMRGTEGILLDMYSNPEKLLAVLEKFTKMAIDSAVASCQASGTPYVWIWMHKGVDEFMSNEMFGKFYWPSFKKYLLGLIDAGITPVAYVEGSYNSRLEFLKDVPKGKVVYNFETIDMANAKKVLGDTACIAGNVPNSILAFGTVQETEDYCKRLIDECGRDGGFMMDSSALIDNAKVENVEAMFQIAEEYGKY